MVRLLVLVLGIFAAPTAFGQTNLEPLLWVADDELAVLTRQLAGDAVRVQSLDQELRRTPLAQLPRLILFCGDKASAEPQELLWRERLSAQGMPQVVLSEINRCRGCARRAGLLRELHAALVQITPEQRVRLDRNLHRELVRLQHHSLSPLLAQSP